MALLCRNPVARVEGCRLPPIMVQEPFGRVPHCCRSGGNHPSSLAEHLLPAMTLADRMIVEMRLALNRLGRFSGRLSTCDECNHRAVAHSRFDSADRGHAALRPIDCSRDSSRRAAVASLISFRSLAVCAQCGRGWPVVKPKVYQVNTYRDKAPKAARFGVGAH